MARRILVERAFDIPLENRVRKVIGTAIYNEVGPETETYCLKFTIKGQLASMMQPDRMYYSIEQANKVVGYAFCSGEIEALMEKKIKEMDFS